MKNKNRIYRVASLLLVLCFISTVMISGTFAKYTSEYSGQDTALIAKWDLDVTDGEDNDFAVSPSDPAELDLFLHSYNTNIVSDAGTDKIIAPGVSGDFVLSVKNNSDVAAEVKFAFDDTKGTATDVPIEYSLKAFDAEGFAKETDAYETVTALAAALNALSEFKTLNAGMTDPATKTVFWRWSFDPTFTGQDNEKDTLLGTTSAGEGGGTTYILTVTATATQLTPGITP